ncbi:hypothetical protein E1B28_011326 [Marasmius oreades]|uniref:Uncharacterized protein n=1 Tax=Marasmius oreades TaxID=181124 RepID=A0A9P7RTU5_9AGAR|nr:uncharacterized protein E1B28_011326 [Marasmius oreades]KAG7089666.1 hypothetical protein E1B28_011326 [Marasmius oreades]
MEYLPLQSKVFLLTHALSMITNDRPLTSPPDIQLFAEEVENVTTEETSGKGGKRVNDLLATLLTGTDIDSRGVSVVCGQIEKDSTSILVITSPSKDTVVLNNPKCVV